MSDRISLPKASALLIAYIFGIGAGQYGIVEAILLGSSVTFVLSAYQLGRASREDKTLS